MNIVDAVRANFKNLFQAHLEEVASELTRLVREQTPALEGYCSEELTHANFLAMAYASSPVCVVLDSGDEKVHRFRITSPPAGSCLGVIIGNDTNAARHIGVGGTTQSNAIIGICTDAVMRALGGELLEVNPLTFRNSIPLGEPVLVEIVLGEPKRLTEGTIVMKRERDGKVILRQAGLKMTLPKK